MTPIDCMTCRSLATHEDCNKDGGCLSTKADYDQYRTSGAFPPFKYRYWIESTPQEQMARLKAMQLSGARNIILGPGEAEINVNRSPKDASAELHRVAEECGYCVGNLTHDKGDGKQSLMVYKDFGPFRIEWENGRLFQIIQGEEDKERIFWTSGAESWEVA